MTAEQDTRVCKTCGESKPLSEFPVLTDRRRGKAYPRPHCSDCWKRAPHKRREYRQGERARAALRQRKPYRATGRPGAYRTIRQVQVMLCLEAHRAHAHWLRHLASNEQVAQHFSAKPWLNPRLSKAEQYQARVKADPEFCLAQRMRRRLRKALRGRCAPGTFEQLFGYTIAELRAHLEQRFAEGMGWHNMGEWHIDHIIPVAAFNQHDAEQFSRCWALSNLQPLWGPDNCSKGARW